MEGETLFSFLALTSEFSSFDCFSDRIFSTLPRRTKRAVSWSDALKNCVGDSSGSFETAPLRCVKRRRRPISRFRTSRVDEPAQENKEREPTKKRDFDGCAYRVCGEARRWTATKTRRRWNASLFLLAERENAQRGDPSGAEDEDNIHQRIRFTERNTGDEVEEENEENNRRKGRRSDAKEFGHIAVPKGLRR